MGAGISDERVDRVADHHFGARTGHRLKVRPGRQRLLEIDATLEIAVAECHSLPMVGVAWVERADVEQILRGLALEIVEREPLVLGSPGQGAAATITASAAATRLVTAGQSER